MPPGVAYLHGSSNQSYQKTNDMNWLRRLFHRPEREPVRDPAQERVSAEKLDLVQEAVTRIEEDPTLHRLIRRRFLEAVRESLLSDEDLKNVSGH